MNDPLKKFIDQNRDDFDDLEPSAHIFSKIKADLSITNVEVKKSSLRIGFAQKWLVAAAVLVVLFSGYLLFIDKDVKTLDTNQTVVNKKTESNLESVKVEPNQLPIKKSVKTSHKVIAVAKQKQKTIDMSTLYRDLADSTSSSTRLAAILDIEKSGIVNYDLIDRLARTLDVDANSNVRLAALNLMGHYRQDEYVSSTFLKALNTQKNPIVQLALIDLLGNIDNPKLDDRLYALANDPNTFQAVKDQAYLVLLNQNKL